MLRTIITIDKDRCDGCALCVTACHEGAIGLVDGKATLLREDYCDGLGDCLPACPTGAITFEKREALSYDALAVQANMEAKSHLLSSIREAKLSCSISEGGCPSAQPKTHDENTSETSAGLPVRSQLRQFPVKIRLVPENAPFFANANLLIAADCTSYAFGDFHNRFMRSAITLIGCPKLDETDYSEKLASILATHTIKTLTVVRMDVPCCGGLTHAVRKAIENSGTSLPLEIVTISSAGSILSIVKE